MGTLSISYNGTAITSESRTSYPTVSYNGSQIIGGFSGTKTLNTANKMMKGNLVIGGKTLNTKDKMMKGNVVATYSPGMTSWANATAPSESSNTYYRNETGHRARCLGQYAIIGQKEFGGNWLTGGKTRNASYYNASMTRGTVTLVSSAKKYAYGCRSIDHNASYTVVSIDNYNSDYEYPSSYTSQCEDFPAYNASLTRTTISISNIADRQVDLGATTNYVIGRPTKGNNPYCINNSLTVTRPFMANTYQTKDATYFNGVCFMTGLSGTSTGSLPSVIINDSLTSSKADAALGGSNSGYTFGASTSTHMLAQKSTDGSITSWNTSYTRGTVKASGSALDHRYGFGYGSLGTQIAMFQYGDNAYYTINTSLTLGTVAPGASEYGWWTSMADNRLVLARNTGDSTRYCSYA